MHATPFPRRLIAALIAAALVTPSTALPAGRNATIALSNQQAGGTAAGTLFGISFGVPVLNASGQVTYAASLLIGTGGVTSANDTGIWRDSTLIAREGSQAPGTPTGAVFNPLLNVEPKLSDSGQVAFSALLLAGSGGVTVDNDNGIWRSTSLIAREGSQAPSTPTGAVFSSFWSSPFMSSAGQVTFGGRLLTGVGGVTSDNDTGIWRDTTLIAREGSQAPDAPTGALYSGFNSPAINASGQVAFSATLRVGTGGVTSSDDFGLWRDSLLIAREGNQAPGTPTGAVFETFGQNVGINDNGQVAYNGILRSGVGGVTSDNDTGIWRDTTLIAREGNQAPGTPTGAVFESFGNPLLNNSGQVAFTASLRTGGGGVTSLDNAGIWRDTTLIAREGSQAPAAPSGAVFQSFAEAALNDNGQVAFQGFLRTGAAGVTTSNDGGLWIVGSNGDALLVAREGDALAGLTIGGLTIEGGSGGSDGRGRAINEFGQLAYRASFTNGSSGIFLFTPELRWIRTFSSSWDTRSNWTIAQAPGAVHDVRIDPDVSLTVTGPTGEVAVNSLTVGGGNGQATLRLSSGVITPTDGPVLIQASGILTGDGRLNAAVENHGTVQAENITLTGDLNNYGLVTGSGRINARLVNQTGGEVRVGNGEFLRLGGSGLAHSSLGQLEVGGGQLQSDGSFTNQNSGRVLLNDGSVRFLGGLTNHGQVLVTFGESSLFGNITNESAGKLIVSQGALTTLYDTFTNKGTLRISQGGAATFFGVLKGNTTTGTGSVRLEGGWTPGFSPILATVTNELFLDSELEMELYGTTPGSCEATAGMGCHDKLIFENIIDLGTSSGLKVTLLGGYLPGAGDSYDLFDWGSQLSGAFGYLNLPTLDPSLFWDTSQLYTEGVLSVRAVPLPGAIWLFAAAVGLLGLMRRSRQTRLLPTPA